MSGSVSWDMNASLRMFHYLFVTYESDRWGEESSKVHVSSPVLPSCTPLINSSLESIATVTWPFIGHKRKSTYSIYYYPISDSKLLWKRAFLTNSRHIRRLSALGKSSVLKYYSSDGNNYYPACIAINFAAGLITCDVNVITKWAEHLLTF